MAYLADLHRTVAATLAANRLGRPVFVRYHCFGPEPSEALAARLAQMTAVVQAWVDQELVRLHANAARDQAHVALTLQFQAGATALISWTHAPPPDAGVDLMILGNRGAIYQEEARGFLGDDAAAFAGPPADSLLQDRIERAVQSGEWTET